MTRRPHSCLIGIYESLFLFTPCCRCEFWVYGETQIFGCIAMGSAVLCIFNSRLLLYSAWSGVRNTSFKLAFYGCVVFEGCVCLASHGVIV